MNEKWRQRKLALNREKMLSNMTEIQELMLEISKVPFSPNQKDVDKNNDKIPINKSTFPSKHELIISFL